jgi:putative ABC transport system permease protein
MPEWKQEMRQRLAGVELEPARETAIVEELSQYLEGHYAELLAGGASEAEAYRQTLAELSGSDLLAHELRRAERQVAPEPIVPGTNRRTTMIADIWPDLRFGARMLMNSPAFTLAAILSLAIGIGANTALYSVVNAVLWRPLPYPGAERLVRVGERGSALAEVFAALKQTEHVFDGLAGWSERNFMLTGRGGPAHLKGPHITAELLLSFAKTLSGLYFQLLPQAARRS